MLKRLCLSLSMLLPVCAVAQVTDRPIPADRLAASLGVNIILNNRTTPEYLNPANAARDIRNLGVRHARLGGYPANDVQSHRAMDVILAANPQLRLTIFSTWFQPGSITAPNVLAASRAFGITRISAWEGPNELDSNGNVPKANWPAIYTQDDKDLYNAVKSNPETANIPVLAGALAFSNNYNKYLPGVDIHDSFDTVAYHPYPAGGPPENTIQKNNANTDVFAGPKAMIGYVATEVGYQDAVNNTNNVPNQSISERAEAIYFPRMAITNLQNKVIESDIFELYDCCADDRARTNTQHNFGLLHYDYTPKPSYTALQQLIAYFNDPAPHPLTPLTYGITGADNKTYHQMFQDSKGNWKLAIWRNLSAFDLQKRQDINNPPITVTLTFLQPYNFSQYRFGPGSTPAPIATANNAKSVKVAVDDQITVVQISPVR